MSSYKLKITPELRARLMHAETIEIDESAELAAAKARIAELERLIEHMGHKAELYDEACALVGKLGHMNVTNAVSALQTRIADLERQAAIGRRAVAVLRSVEWSYAGDEYCPKCGTITPRHANNCELAAILRDAEQANSRVILGCSVPEPATVAVDAGTLDQLRVTVDAYDKAWADDMPQRQKIAALQMAEAARRLLAGGGK